MPKQHNHHIASFHGELGKLRSARSSTDTARQDSSSATGSSGV
jgi:hypothetical protein